MWLVAVGVAGRCAALTAAVNVILRSDAPVFVFLCIVLAGTAGCILLVQPSQQLALELHQLWQLLAHASALVVTLALWCYGLKQCGPTRTVLLDASEMGMVTVLAMVLRGNGAVSHLAKLLSFAGIAMLISAYALLLLGAPAAIVHADRTRSIESKSIGWPNPHSSHTSGEVALLLAAALTALRRSMSSRLAHEMGGSIRLYGLCAAIGASLPHVGLMLLLG